ncbi:cilia- and flagella-associated protein 119-like [Corticium candelabrum]|uniref:cilia- and flagella-associated protein 119-like n=1 Tax=Corticium candelabrum TaxID=121492 RepID=UPI002E276A43|nr:cilia- and flagella-associated protein 119-like [Corticium candelabrum]
MPSGGENSKPMILLWADLTLEHLDRLCQCATTEEKMRLIGEIFHLEDFETNLKSGIIADLYFYALQFAEENSFSYEQTSAFFSIVKATHHKCIETPYDSMQETYEFFKSLLLCHSVKRPPYSIGIFAMAEVEKIRDYVLKSYFKHFRMYKYAFTPKVRLDISFHYSGLPETPPPEPAAADEDQIPIEEEVGNNGDIDSVQQTEESIEEPATEESEAVQGLRKMMEATFAGQLEQLKASVDEQLKSQDKKLLERLSAMESKVSGKTISPPRSRKK